MRPELARRFSFFALVELLEREFRAKAHIGHRGPALDEVVRFETDPSLAFPISEVLELEEVSREEKEVMGIAGPRYRMSVAMMGLVGVVSPLPLFYTEQIIQSDRDENAQRIFLDLFQHRAISFLYRAWLKYRYAPQFEPSAKDEVSRRLLAAMGFGSPEELESMRVRPGQLLRYAGLFYSKPKSASGLRSILFDFLGVAVTICQCVVQWTRLPASQTTKFGTVNSTLGGDLTVGDRVRTLGAGFAIVIGPIAFGRVREFLPTTRRFADLVHITRLFVTDRLSFNVQVLVDENTIEPLMLQTAGDPRLGWTTFLGKRPRAAGRIDRLESIPFAVRKEGQNDSN
jgi:type VI secretion system protein ImpH